MSSYVQVPFRAIPELVKHYRAVQKTAFQVREKYKGRSDGYATTERDNAASRRSWVSSCLQAVLQEHLSKHMTIDDGLRQIAGQWCVPYLYEDDIIRFCEAWVAGEVVANGKVEYSDKDIVQMLVAAVQPVPRPQSADAVSDA